MDLEQKKNSIQSRGGITRTLERLSLLVVLLCVLLKNSLPYNGIIITVTLGMLAVSYYINAVRKVRVENVSSKEVFIFKLHYISLPLVLISVVFNWMHWPGADVMALTACGLLITVIIMGYPYVKNNSSLITTQLAIRTFIFFFVALFIVAKHYTPAIS